MNALLAAVSAARFNHTLHYRYTDVGEVLGYLISERPGDRWTLFDSLECEVDWPLLRTVAAGVDLLVFFADVAAAPRVRRLATMARAVSPGVRIAVYGKAPLRIPHYFQRPPFDAVYRFGDQEHALLTYRDHIVAGAPVLGMWCNTQDRLAPGIRLTPSRWSYPALDRLPLRSYRRVALAKEVPFELSVYPSRGCPHAACVYCDAWLHEGTVDRRRDPADLSAWTARAVADHAFDCVQMHSADFAADSAWAEAFCASYRARGCRFAWTCCCRVDSLSARLLQAMAAAGCVRVGVGVETLPQPGAPPLKADLPQIRTLARWGQAASVALKAYIMAGLPGQTEADLLRTYLTCRDLGYIVRVSTYTPFHRLTRLTLAELDAMDLSELDRKSYCDPDAAVPMGTVLRLVLRPPGVDAWARRRLTEVV